MGTYIVKMPDIGEGIAEVELVAWSVKPGDVVKEDQPLADVMTDKATVEIPSPVAGTVVALGGDVGQLMAVGSELIRLEVAGAGNLKDGPPARPAADVQRERPASAPAPALVPAPAPVPAAPKAAAIRPRILASRQSPLTRIPSMRKMVSPAATASHAARERERRSAAAEMAMPSGPRMGAARERDSMVRNASSGRPIAVRWAMKFRFPNDPPGARRGEANGSSRP